MKNDFFGKWRIVEMELWDLDFIDAEVQGFIKFSEDGMGEFQFGYVHGFIDCEYSTDNKGMIVNFSWDGNDEMDPVSGRGTGVLIDNVLQGHIFFHQGDNSEFVATYGVCNGKN
jgi:hypothetical protein